MNESSIANAADYADALLTARKAKNLMVLLILVIILFQLVLFFAARYKIDLGSDVLTGSSSLAHPTTRPASPAAIDLLKYTVGFLNFLGVVLPILLLADLWLIASIMLIGRLLGVSRLIASFLWCAVLIALLFPWQAFLMNQTFTSTEFKIPGVLYTWSELVVRGRLHPSGIMLPLLYWARFVGWPLVAVILTLMIHNDSRLGLRSALNDGSPKISGETKA